MNEITDITPQVKDKRRCNIYVDGRFCCGLTLETTMKNRLKVGRIISPEKLSEIQLESEKNTAFDKALTHISATQKTEKQVRDFLSKKGYLPAVIDYVVEKLRSYDFLNDGAYAENYVGFAAKKKGGRLIRMELRGKGIDENDIDAALETIDEEQEIQTASEILEKYMRHKTRDKETLQKAYRYLMGKGFEYETIRAALKAYGAYGED
ncbi:MAG: hypothetical protein E7349_01020 [Clostridiales bacterium]|nr:hypothetical protein [Clostridiales bacterium]